MLHFPVLVLLDGRVARFVCKGHTFPTGLAQICVGSLPAKSLNPACIRVAEAARRDVWHVLGLVKDEGHDM